MKKKIFILAFIALLVFPLFAIAEDSKEVLILKRDVAIERILRFKAELALMQKQFQEGKQVLQQVEANFLELDAKLKALEKKELDEKAGVKP